MRKTKKFWNKKAKQKIFHDFSNDEKKRYKFEFDIIRQISSNLNLI